MKDISDFNEKAEKESEKKVIHNTNDDSSHLDDSEDDVTLADDNLINIETRVPAMYRMLKKSYNSRSRKISFL